MVRQPQPISGDRSSVIIFIDETSHPSISWAAAAIATGPRAVVTRAIRENVLKAGYAGMTTLSLQFTGFFTWKKLWTPFIRYLTPFICWPELQAPWCMLGLRRRQPFLARAFYPSPLFQ